MRTMPSGQANVLPKLGTGLLTLAVLAFGTGCGSRASDEEIAEALRGPVAAAASPLAGTSSGVIADPATAAVGAADPGVVTERPGQQVPAAPAGSVTAREAQSATGSGLPKPTSPAAPLAANKSMIKIGQLGVFSGVLGAVSQTMPKALGAWVAYTNAHGGLNGHPVKLIVGDDQGDPATALTLAKRMVESDKILAMVGNLNVFGFPQIETYMREKNVPMIGGDGIDPGWFTSPVAFPISAPASTQIIKGFEKLVKEGKSKLGILYCLEVSALCSYLNSEVQKSEVGKHVVQTHQVSLVAPSYTSQCLRMKEAGLDAVYLITETAAAARVARDCAAQGFAPQFMLLAIAVTKDVPSIPALSAALIPGGTVSPAAVVPGMQKYRDVTKVYAASIGDSGAGLLAWASGELLGLVGRNLPDIPTPQDLLAALGKIKNETLGGLTVPLTYVPGKGANVKPCAFIWGMAANRWTAPTGAEPVC